MGREVAVLTALEGRVPVPAVLGADLEGDVLGTPFFVMEHVEGEILRSTSPDARHDGARRRRRPGHVRGAPRRRPRGRGTRGLRAAPTATSAARSRGWTRRYARAATDETGLGDVLAWLDQNQPAESGAALVHNDYKYDNVVPEPRS